MSDGVIGISELTELEWLFMPILLGQPLKHQQTGERAFGVADGGRRMNEPHQLA
jgi:hypothetical protein